MILKFYTFVKKHKFVKYDEKEKWRRKWIEELELHIYGAINCNNPCSSFESVKS